MHSSEDALEWDSAYQGMYGGSGLRDDISSYNKWDFLTSSLSNWRNITSKYYLLKN